MVENGRPVGSGEAVGLDPGVCEVSSRSVSRLRRVSFRARAKSSEATREVDRFRVHCREPLFIERVAGGEALHLGDHRRIRQAVG